MNNTRNQYDVIKNNDARIQQFKTTEGEGEREREKVNPTGIQWKEEENAESKDISVIYGEAKYLSSSVWNMLINILQKETWCYA